MEAQIYRVASALVCVAGAILLHGSLTTGDTAAFVAGHIGAVVSVGVGIVGISLVAAGMVGGSGYLRDFPGKKPAACQDQQAEPGAAADRGRM